MIVAIDGPAGAGKSTVARRVAEELGFGFLDTGALYRAVAWASLDRGRRPQDIVDALHIEEIGDRILVDGVDVTEAIRSPEVTRLTPSVAKRREVRRALLVKQRAILSRGNWVAEGRDIGSVVAPGAELKVFLDATPEARARRRAAETGESEALVLQEIRARDEHDATRTESPLIRCHDAQVVDSTRKTADAVVDEIVRLARAVAPAAAR